MIVYKKEKAVFSQIVYSAILFIIKKYICLILLIAVCNTLEPTVNSK